MTSSVASSGEKELKELRSEYISGKSELQRRISSIETYEMKIWGAHAIKGTDGAKVIDELKPHDSDYMLFQSGHTALSTEQASTSI